MSDGKSLTLCSLVLLLLVLLLAECSHAKPSKDPASTSDSELSDLSGAATRNKTSVRAAGEEYVDSDADSGSSELTPNAFPHRDEDQLNSATNLVLARNYKYDVEILESGDAEDDSQSAASEELEERFKSHGILAPDTEAFTAENIEMQPVDVEADAISESHMLLGIIAVVLALVSICLYAGLVIWRSHLEQRYGMRERLVNRDLEEDGEGIDDLDYHVYAPTTTPATTRA
ncbi:uncharacterized protein LOC117589660 [Drosophila guanche]|uniref:Uncharacterized protein n=1 Tax=Drosophila guanche TaxID=7266 RepID=A0A3B0KUP2_DROGU|nr:uncharacterized protein LOC117589660 [Drosophila guanche]SPP87668.1 Hypothetical predicted protein [Drosophila guanche]